MRRLSFSLSLMLTLPATSFAADGEVKRSTGPETLLEMSLAQLTNIRARFPERPNQSANA